MAKAARAPRKPRAPTIPDDEQDPKPRPRVWGPVEQFGVTHPGVTEQLGMVDEVAVALPSDPDGKPGERVTAATPIEGGLCVALAPHAALPCLTVTHAPSGRGVSPSPRLGARVRLPVTAQGMAAAQQAIVNLRRMPIDWTSATPFAHVGPGMIRAELTAALHLAIDAAIFEQPGMELVLELPDEGYADEVEVDRRAEFFGTVMTELGAHAPLTSLQLLQGPAGINLRDHLEPAAAMALLLGWLVDARYLGLLELRSGAWVLAC